ncbi:hypothetical protein DASC09_020270 [Saccharomycopsis crataegensis]|uniref:Uncharacterized protein n=1 Tax=Saccharomycopsis crataegensis TaxID=43959 RepID=A0AAV5QJG5_9ASCO|nr:hypothetical protein DASC09_020270 [Saccharomycopsis crataegensis]
MMVVAVIIVMFIMVFSVVVTAEHLKHFANLIFEKYPFIFPGKNKHDFLVEFDRYKASTQVCGVVLFDESLSKIVLIQSSLCNSWRFPSCTISKVDNALESAIRACLYQTGIDVSGLVHEDYIIERTIQGITHMLYMVKILPERTIF